MALYLVPRGFAAEPLPADPASPAPAPEISVQEAAAPAASAAPYTAPSIPQEGDFFDPPALSSSAEEETQPVAYNPVPAELEEKPRIVTAEIEQGPVYRINYTDIPQKTLANSVTIEHLDGTTEYWNFKEPVKTDSLTERPQQFMKRVGNPDEYIVRYQGVKIQETTYEDMKTYKRISATTHFIYGVLPTGGFDKNTLINTVIIEYSYSPNGDIKIEQSLYDTNAQLAPMPDGSPNPKITYGRVQ